MKTRLSYWLPSLTLTALVSVAFASSYVDYDHKADFGKYRTYTWLGVMAGNSIWQQRIMDTVDAQLTARGWQRTPSGGSAEVSAFGKIEERDTLQTYYDGFPGWGWRGWGGGGFATTTVIPETIGNLTVDIFDGKTKQLIWRGTATKTLSTKKPEKNDKKLDSAVADLFKRFPPNGRT